MTWSTYEAIKDATIAGHDMELVAFVEYCDILNGPSFEQTGLVSMLQRLSLDSISMQSHITFNTKDESAEIFFFFLYSTVSVS
jgi:hypothetical protein